MEVEEEESHHHHHHHVLHVCHLGHFLNVPRRPPCAVLLFSILYNWANATGGEEGRRL